MEMKTVKSIVSTWLSSANSLKTHLEVPPCARCKYITTGYRPYPSSFTYCLKSVFTANNETLNFWTHFIALILMLRRTIHVSISMDDSYSILNYLYYLHSFGMCYVFLVSSMAHMLSPMSTWCQRTCFSFDYSAIVIMGTSMQIALEHLVCPVRCFPTIQGIRASEYLWISLVLSCFTTTTCIASENFRNYTFILRSIPLFSGIVLVHSPCIARFFFKDTEHVDDQCFHLAESYGLNVFWQFLLILLGCIVFGAHFPESCFKGQFDIIGHSHQLFHILIALGVYNQNIIVEGALKEAKEKMLLGFIKESDLGVSWENSVILFFVSFTSCNLITILWSLFVHKHDHCD